MTPRSRPHSILERAREYLATSSSSPQAEGIGSTEKYVIITEAGLVRLLDRLGNAEEVALDLETSGLDPFADTVEVVSLAACTPDGLLNELVCARALDVSPLLNLLSGKDLLLFNAKFDLKFLMHRYGYFHRGKVHDLMVSFLMVHYGIEGERTARVRGCLRVPDPLDKKRPKGEKVRANLRYVSDCYLGAENPVTNKSHQSADWTRRPLTAEMVEYALADSRVLLALSEELGLRLEAEGMGSYPGLEGDAVLALAWCELNGMALDKGTWLAIEAKNKARAGGYLRKLLDLCPTAPEYKEDGWNLHSTQQRTEILELLGGTLATLPKTPTGKPSTSEKALAELSGAPAALRWRDAYLKWAEAQKFARDFGGKWVEGEWYRDGRLHADYKPLVSTGRQSCQDPPLQQMPKRSDPQFRRAFRAPEGRTLVIADFKMIELVVGAEIAEEPEMQKVFNDPEAVDLHTKTALEVFEAAGADLDPEKLKELRDRAKIVNFGIFYGMSPSGLQKTFKEVFWLGITPKQAQGYIERVMGLYKSVARWQEGVRDACLGQGKETASTPLGRKRLLPVWEGSGVVNVNAAFNHPVQGGAADALKLVMGKLYRHHRQLPGNPKLVGMVHDEVIIECDEQTALMVREDLERYMVEAVREAVRNPECPVAVEIDVRPTWGEQGGS
jgi:DNA polymerase-1